MIDSEVCWRVLDDTLGLDGFLFSPRCFFGAFWGELDSGHYEGLWSFVFLLFRLALVFGASVICTLCHWFGHGCGGGVVWGFFLFLLYLSFS